MDHEAVYSVELAFFPPQLALRKAYQNLENSNSGFMSPCSVSKNIDDLARNIANRLATRGNNDIILLPFNPGRHWVLVVLVLKSFCCYYIDSLCGSACSLLKKTIEAAMALNNVRIGLKKRATKVNWVKAKVSMN